MGVSYEDYILPKNLVAMESDGWNFYSFNSEPTDHNVIGINERMVND